MSGFEVPPGQLRAFAGACRGQAGEIAALGGDGIGSGVAGDLPSTRTAETVSTSGDDVEAAVQTLAQRLREMADVADGVQDNYEATEAEIVAGFEAMSRP